MDQKYSDLFVMPRASYKIDLSQTLKIQTGQNSTSAVQVSNDTALHLENQLLKEQINKLNHLMLQYQFTNKKALQTLHDNILLQEKATTLELKLGCLSEALEIQHLEICRRDHLIKNQVKDLSEHKKRINVLSDKYEENGYPACNLCFRHPPILSKCENHPEEDQIVGCVFCALQKCPICRGTKIKHVSSLQNESKKIKKPPKEKKKRTSHKKTKKV